jgi:glucosamine--fructose-6-phosphate aminotransferase (isomerizing)
MCGIIGVLGRATAAPLLLDGLRRLEYRGYDSAGIATLHNGTIERRRAEGKLDRLVDLVEADAPDGMPTTDNAHPHSNAKVAVVHNGIIENFQALRDELSACGHVFETETDTEVVVHLLSQALDDGQTPQQATQTMLGRVEGAFALGILFAGHHNLLIAARLGSPLAIGYGDGEMFLGSDAMALAPLTRRICYLEEGDWAEITRAGAVVYDHNGAVAKREVRETALTGAAIGKGNHRHFMHKEIHEQPTVIGDTLHSFFNPAERRIVLPDLAIDLAKIERLSIVACGTSFYAGLVARYWFERFARLPVDIDIASEYRYRDAPPTNDTVGLFISQSGETADTLAALRHAKQQGQATLSLVNVPESTMDRESSAVLYTLAGPEIGVASTKAFTTQLATLACLAIACGRVRGTVSDKDEARLSKALLEVPARAAEVRNHDEHIREIGDAIQRVRDVLYIGRGTSYAIALEGALKLKEISYIHAEAYAAGELKHGPIALIDDGVPVIVIAPSDALFEKTASNIEEVAARGGRVILISDEQGVARLGGRAAECITMPAVDALVAPILYALPVQLLAYHVAVFKGTDVDQPRNLAKSVTVE